MTETFASRAAIRAAAYSPSSALGVILSVLLAPLWLLGACAGVLWLVVTMAWGAAATGFGDVKVHARGQGPSVGET